MNIAMHIDKWIPESVAGEIDQKLRARGILLMMAMCSGSVALIAAALLMSGLITGKFVWDGIIASIGVSLVWYGGIVYFRRSGDLDMTSHLFAFIMFSSTFSAVMVTGGWTSPVCTLMLGVPVGIFLVAGRKIGLLWIILSALSYYVLFLLHRNGVHFIQVMAAEHRLPLTIGMWVFSCIIIAGCMTVYDHMAELLKITLRADREIYRTKVSRDSVSGLYNRQGFIEVLQGRIGQASEKPFQLVCVQLSNLPAINFEYGYRAGDELIRLWAEACCTVFGAEALVSRLEGGVFLMTTPPDVVTGADDESGGRIKQQLGQQIFLPSIGKPVQPELKIALLAVQSAQADSRRLMLQVYEMLKTST